ncbi:MAG: kinase [Gammaproteobacteria bacterium]|nr:kinase [Gammaproteobacteria bacterium]
MALQPVVTPCDLQVVDWLQQRASHQSLPLIGVQGAQGAGKTTRCKLWADTLKGRGITALVLALDDFYLSYQVRQQLAASVHPLMASRGVPGSHDIARIHQCIDQLQHDLWPLSLPSFDKGRDDRSADRRIDGPVRLVLLEGWCVGVPAEPDLALAQPLNHLEAEEDSDGRWRRYINQQLAGPYTQLWQRLDGLISLEIPGFEWVARWRGQQEQALRQQHPPQGMDEAALARFIAHFERLTRHALRVMPALADLRLPLGADHQPHQLIQRFPP